MGNVASAALNGYSHLLDVRPLCTRAITASCLAGFGDFFSQLLYSPFSTALFLTVPYTLEGKAKEVPNLWRSNYITTLCSSICTWTPANFITFRFIPLKYSVLFVNCVSLFWNSYASWKGHVVKSKKTE